MFEKLNSRSNAHYKVRFMNKNKLLWNEIKRKYLPPKSYFIVFLLIYLFIYMSLFIFAWITRENWSYKSEKEIYLYLIKILIFNFHYSENAILLTHIKRHSSAYLYSCDNDHDLFRTNDSSGQLNKKVNWNSRKYRYIDKL